MSVADLVLPLPATCPLPFSIQERRRQKRWTCRPTTACRITAEEAEPIWALKVQNISVGGAKIMVSSVAPIDRLRTVTFFNSDRGIMCERAIWRAYQFRTAEGLLILGIAFAKEIAQEELATFV